VSLSRLTFAKRRALLNVTVEEYVQSLRNETRRVESVTDPRLTCTETRPLHPVDLEIPLGNVNRPEVRKRNLARTSDAGVTRALNLPRRRVIDGGDGGFGPTTGGFGPTTGGFPGGVTGGVPGGGGGLGAGASLSTYNPELTSLTTMLSFAATSTPTTFASPGMLFVGSGLSGGTNDAISVGLALVKSIARSPFACPATKAVDPRAIA